ncbi:MAG: excinuclease ABC subunit UvrC [Spirochaetaceae bacterium]|nr:MAG: excinuclease ABC subunit UvrC [Spirochaetaceae bacterium]
MEKAAEIQAKIREIEDAPGVYIMKDDGGKIIYIGKARSLRKRVSSYWTGEKDIKTRQLLSHVADIEVIITRNEHEALITENNLIKQNQPKYNINLKDGKTYPLIRITNEPFPRIFRTRKLVLDGSRYFGPFPSVQELDITIELIEKLYPLRKCRGQLKKRNNPCMYFHIGRCAGPCAGKITEEEYARRVDEVIRLLEGDTTQLQADIRAKMEDASARLDFEKAAFFRDQLQALALFGETPSVLANTNPREDYIGLAVKDDFVCFVVVRTQEGRILTKQVFRSPVFEKEPQEILAEFLFQYYLRAARLPEKAYVPLDLGADFRTALGERLEQQINILVPESGKEYETLRMAVVNADQEMRISHVDGLVQLRETLGLPSLPVRIEGFDIAHLAGTHTVASMVSFFQGRPDPQSYRRFKIKTLAGDERVAKVDDFESMREVIARRYSRLVAEGESLPDLILIDGGKGQLEAALGILRTLDLGDVPIAGLAKLHEELFVPGKTDPILLPLTSPALRVLVAVRNESHRFATTFHKLLRDKELAGSFLEKAKGVGKKKAAMLLTQFGSLEKIMEAEAGDIAKAGRISVEHAAALKLFLEDEIGEEENP